jgi:MFS family permease
MQPIYGRLSDIFGRKVVLLASLLVFWIGSLACALAQVCRDPNLLQSS